MYFDINDQIERDCVTIENILKFTSGAGVKIAMTSNYRDTLWHNKIIDTRGKAIDFIIAEI